MAILQLDFSSLDRDDCIHDVFKRAFVVVFAHIVTHLLSQSISFLKTDSHSTLLPFFCLTLATIGLRDVTSIRRHLSHLNSSDSTISCSRSIRTSSCQHTLLTLSIAQQMCMLSLDTDISTSSA